MIENPRDEAGNPLMFPGAPRPDPVAFAEAQFEHLVRIAELDVRYARWRAGTMGKDCPEWFGELLPRLDAHLTARGIKWPPPYVEPPSKLPPLLKGRRALPPKRYFHDTLP